MAIRVAVADDHPLVLRGLVAMLAGSDEHVVVGTAMDGDQALALVRTERPHVLVVDLRLSGRNGLELTRSIAAEGLPTRVITLGDEIADDEALEAIRSGVHGVVLKRLALDLLRRCIAKVHAGGRWIERDSEWRAAEMLVHRGAARPVGPSPAAFTLTRAELRVIEAMPDGARTREIAGRLKLAESTVKNHLRRIYAKADVAGRRDLLAWYRAQRATLEPPDR